MATLTVYADAGDGHAFSSNGGASASSVDDASTVNYIEDDAGGKTEFFASFDTSSLDDAAVISAADLSLKFSGYSGTNPFLEARLYDWGGTLETGDWRTAAQLGGLTLLATRDTTGQSGNTRYSFTSDAAFISNVSKTGSTRMVIHCRRTRNGTDAVGYATVWSADNSGTTDDPSLTVTYTVPTAWNGVAQLYATATISATARTAGIGKLLSAAATASATMTAIGAATKAGQALLYATATISATAQTAVVGLAQFYSDTTFFARGIGPVSGVASLMATATISATARVDFAGVLPLFIYESALNPALTFARASVAYRSDGALVVAAVPRHEPGKYGPGVLIEEGTTNLLSANQAEPVDATGWTLEVQPGDAGARVVDQQVTFRGLPVIRADITAIGANGGYPRLATNQFGTAWAIGTKVTASCWIKGPAGQPASFAIYQNGSSKATVGFNFTGAWQLVSTTWTTDVANPAIAFRFADLHYVTSVWVAMPQIEAKAFRTSWHPGGATRAAETLTLPLSGVLSAAGPWTVELWCQAGPTGTDRRLLDAFDGTRGYRIKIGADNAFAAFANEGATIVGVSGGAAVTGTWYHVAVTNDGTRLRLYINGSLAATSAVITVPASMPATAAVASQFNGTQQANGVLDDMRISNRVRTAQEIQDSYTLGKAISDADTTLLLLGATAQHATSTLSATGSYLISGAATMAAAASLTVVGSLNHGARATMGADTALLAVGLADWSGAATLAALANLAAVGRLDATGAATAAAQASLAVVGSLNHGGRAGMWAEATIDLNPSIIYMGRGQPFEGLGYWIEVSGPGGTDFPVVEQRSFSSEEESPGGYVSAVCTVAPDVVEDMPDVYQYGAEFTAFGLESGEEVFHGTLLKPEQQDDGTYRLVVKGDSAKASTQMERRLYAYYGTEAWHSPDEKPFDLIEGSRNRYDGADFAGDGAVVDGTKRKLDDEGDTASLGDVRGKTEDGLDDGERYTVSFFGYVTPDDKECKVRLSIMEDGAEIEHVERTVDNPKRDRWAVLDWQPAAGHNYSFRFRKVSGGGDPVLIRTSHGKLGDVTSQKINARAAGRSLHWNVHRNTGFRGGEASSLVFWEREQDLSRVAAEIETLRPTDKYQLELAGTDRLNGKLKTLHVWQLDADALDDYDGEITFDLPRDADYEELLWRLKRKEGAAGKRKNARGYWLRLRDPWVYGVARRGDYSVSDIDRDVAGLLGLSENEITGSGQDVLPLYHQEGAYGDLLDAVHLLDDTTWGLFYKGGQTVLRTGPYSKRTWWLDDPHAVVKTVSIERFNAIRAPYRAEGGQRDYVTVVSDPNPFPPGVRNTFDLQLDDPLPGKEIVRAFCEKILRYISRDRAGGTGEFVSVRDAFGVLRPAHCVNAGDTLVVKGRALRVVGLSRSEMRVKATFDSGHPLLEKFLSGRNRRLAMGIPTGRATMPGYAPDRPDRCDVPAVTFKVREHKEKLTYNMVATAPAVTTDERGEQARVTSYECQARPVEEATALTGTWQDSDGDWWKVPDDGEPRRKVHKARDDDDPDDDPEDPRFMFGDVERPKAWRWQARVRADEKNAPKGKWSAWSDPLLPFAAAPAAVPPDVTGLAIDYDQVEKNRHVRNRAVVRGDEILKWDIPGGDKDSDLRGYELEFRRCSAAGVDLTVGKPRNQFIPAKRDDDGNDYFQAVFYGIKKRNYYQARARTISEYGHKGDWSGGPNAGGWTDPSTPLDNTRPPGIVGGSLVVDVDQHRIQVQCDLPTSGVDGDGDPIIDEDIDHSHVRLYRPDGSLFREDRFLRGERRTWRVKKPGNGNWTVRWVTVDASGNKSHTWAAAPSAQGNRQAPPQPSAPAIGFDTVERRKGDRIRAVVALSSVGYTDDDIHHYEVEMQASANGVFTATDHRVRDRVPEPTEDVNDPLTAWFKGIKRYWRYRARVRAIDKQTKASPWSAWSTTQQAGDPDAPPAPTFVTVETDVKGCQVQLGDPDDDNDATTAHPDVTHYEIEVHSNSSFTNLLRRDRHHTGTKKRFKGIDEGQAVYARARSVSSSGTKSGWVTSTGITTAPVIDTPQLVDDAVRAAKIAGGEVGNSEIGSGAVSTDELDQSGAVIGTGTWRNSSGGTRVEIASGLLNEMRLYQSGYSYPGSLLSGGGFMTIQPPFQAWQTGVAIMLDAGGDNLSWSASEVMKSGSQRGYCALQVPGGQAGAGETWSHGVTFGGATRAVSTPSFISLSGIGSDNNVSSVFTSDISSRGFMFKITVNANAIFARAAREYST